MVRVDQDMRKRIIAGGANLDKKLIDDLHEIDGKNTRG